jgi:hypothetical protein
METQVMEQVIYLQESEMNNKLFCTFSSKERIDEKLAEINREYKILYGKIFVLSSPESEEYLCTYNIEPEGREIKILPNTILLHRKKESNTLYTINALNVLIKSINNDVLDPTFPIPWKEYQNSVLLTQDSHLRKLNTLIHRIVTV